MGPHYLNMNHSDVFSLQSKNVLPKAALLLFLKSKLMAILIAPDSQLGLNRVDLYGM